MHNSKAGNFPPLSGKFPASMPMYKTDTQGIRCLR